MVRFPTATAVAALFLLLVAVQPSEARTNGNEVGVNEGASAPLSQSARYYRSRRRPSYSRRSPSYSRRSRSPRSRGGRSYRSFLGRSHNQRTARRHRNWRNRRPAYRSRNTRNQRSAYRSRNTRNQRTSYGNRFSGLKRRSLQRRSGNNDDDDNDGSNNDDDDNNGSNDDDDDNDDENDNGNGNKNNKQGRCSQEYWSCGGYKAPCCGGMTCRTSSYGSGYCVKEEEVTKGTEQNCVAAGGDCDSPWGYSSNQKNSCCVGSTCQSKGRRQRGYTCVPEVYIPAPSPQN